MSNPALILIDVQSAIDDPSWGDDRNNPDAEEKMAALLAHWRERKWPVFHVRHASTNPKSTYRSGQPLFEFKKEVTPIDGEEIVEKSTNSAFIGTNLEERLRSQKIEQVVIAGVITNNSVEATTRMSGNLGFETFVASDATATFGRNDFAGRWRTAEEVHAMSLANLEGEYATVLSTEAILRRFVSQGAELSFPFLPGITAARRLRASRRGRQRSVRR
jgi:nicotinamidase-related amidase